MEAEKALKQKVSTAAEVVVVIPGIEETSKMSRESGDSRGITALDSITPASPGMGRLSPLNPTQKPPSETGFRRRLIARSPYSKPKSRLVEPLYPSNLKLIEKRTNKTPPASSPYGGSPFMASTSNGDRVGVSKGNKWTSLYTQKTPGSITPKTPLMASPGGEDGDYDDDVYTAEYLQDQVEGEKRGKKVEFLVLIEWIIFISIMGVLIASLTIEKLRTPYLWGLHIWRWCVLILVVFSGHLVTQWFMDVLVFLIERSFLLKKKVLYFVHGLRKSVRVFVWLSLILLAWVLLINRGVRRSTETTRILNYITRGIASSLIGAAMWMVKTLLIKLLASSFHVTTFFDKIQLSIFHQYVLQTLSGPPLLKSGGGSKSSGRLSFKCQEKGIKKGTEEQVIDVDKLNKMRPEKISAWTMEGLIKVIRSNGLSTISNLLDDTAEDEGIEQKDIESEFEAKAAAKQIFKKVAKSGNKYIDEDDLSRYFPKEEVDDVLLLFEGAAETGQIKKATFKSWVVKVYNERKYLEHSLNDSKTAVEELNKIASGIILVVIIIVWLLLMGFATTQVLVFISSQILLVVFMFGNTCKVVFESIIFVFITHPFDVGDRCVVDGVQMLVEEMNILTTIFLRYDNEMIYYPNSVLATKPISNFNRSPPMGDSVEFAVDFSTSAESIAALKTKIKSYLESNSQKWRPGHSVQIKEIENLNKLKMVLNVTHTINFQNSSERSSSRSDLVFELKKIFEDLGIKYHLLPQEVVLRYYVGSGTLPSTTANAQ